MAAEGQYYLTVQFFDGTQGTLIRFQRSDPQTRQLPILGRAARARPRGTRTRAPVTCALRRLDVAANARGRPRARLRAGVYFKRLTWSYNRYHYLENGSSEKSPGAPPPTAPRLDARRSGPPRPPAPPRPPRAPAPARARPYLKVFT
ncbi:hypothetical protein EVAR_66958_1 [Eumeta japonica]|uniref:Uncharacterized protein n=1 Tax=Eumeta variegata TaxID=151549 RepID=A0A4C1ZWN8_EUMVA|nr:hypothetical protein EVAR_66958_1 [Eumeta japonica]